MMRMGMLMVSAVVTMSLVACSRGEKADEKVGETHTTSATPSAPAEANPAPASPVIEVDDDGAKDAGHIAPPGGRARLEGAKDAGAHRYDGNLNLTPQPTGAGRTMNGKTPTGTVDTGVGPGHIMFPALPDDHRATGAPNSDGSHNIGTGH